MSTTIFFFITGEIYGGGYSSYLLNTKNLEFKKFLFLYQSSYVQIQSLLEAALFPVRAVKGLIEAADDALPLVVKVSIISYYISVQTLTYKKFYFTMIFPCFYL